MANQWKKLENMVDEWPKYIYLKKNNSKHFLPRLSYGNIPYRNNLQANNVTYVWFIYRVYQNIFHIFVLYIYIYIYILSRKMSAYFT